MRASTNYKYREIAGEYYLIPVGTAAEKSKDPIQLSETAAWIWRHIDEKDCPSLEVLAEKMTDDYEVTLTQARISVQQFLTALKERGLLEQ